MKSRGAPGTCGGFFDVPGKRLKIAEIEERMSAPGFWDRQEVAQKIVSEVSQLKQAIGPVVSYQKRLEDLRAMCELAEELDGDEARQYELEIEDTARSMRSELDELEIKSFLSGRFDRSNAIMSIHAGAGGTESCDWAEMLLRMYTRWAERRGLGVEVEDLQAGDEAGVSRATLRLVGENAYGFIKAERGVHRLVRISPFDANKRRHTSFCAVDVIAEVEDDVEVEIREEDLRVDTYRSSGKGEIGRAHV